MENVIVVRDQYGLILDVCPVDTDGYRQDACYGVNNWAVDVAKTEGVDNATIFEWLDGRIASCSASLAMEGPRVGKIRPIYDDDGNLCLTVELVEIRDFYRLHESGTPGWQFSNYNDY